MNEIKLSNGLFNCKKLIENKLFSKTDIFYLKNISKISNNVKTLNVNKTMQAAEISCGNPFFLKFKSAFNFSGKNTVNDSVKSKFSQNVISENQKLIMGMHGQNKLDDVDSAIELKEIFCSHKNAAGDEKKEIAEVFKADINRNVYIVNDQVISRPGDDAIIAIEKFRSAIKKDGNIDGCGLYAISRFANQAMLAAPTILWMTDVQKKIPGGVNVGSGKMETIFNIANIGDGYKISAICTKNIKKVAKGLCGEDWINVADHSHIKYYAEINLSRDIIENIDRLLLSDGVTRYVGCLETGYDVQLALP